MVGEYCVINIEPCMRLCKCLRYIPEKEQAKVHSSLVGGFNKQTNNLIVLIGSVGRSVLHTHTHRHPYLIKKSVNPSDGDRCDYYKTLQLQATRCRDLFSEKKKIDAISWKNDFILLLNAQRSQFITKQVNRWSYSAHN